VAAAVAAVDGAGKRRMITMRTLKMLAILAVAAIGLGTGLALAVSAPARTFPTASEAVKVFVTAVRADDVNTMQAILGPEGETIANSGDPVADKEARARFLAAYDERATLVNDDATSVTLVIGNDKWPLPIPIVKGREGWYFDSKAGRDELLARRIGRNELFTIEAARAYVDAQREYASDDRGDGVLDYAQRFFSTQGRKDGLYWQTTAGQPESPLGPAFARAHERGYAPGGAAKPEPFNGYYYKILKAQGPAANGGAYSYVAHGKMIGGFALIAYPARYGVSGIMTFIVNHDGVVFQKDLGPDTAQVAAKIEAFDPGKGWVRVANSPQP
jgi:hypothetical protein